MKVKSIIAALLLLVAGMQTAQAQKMKIYFTDNQEVMYDISKIDRVEFETSPGEAHEYVDLGLPSGTLWATTNIGATTPEDYGDYFAWGETEPKSNYSWSTYKWMNEGQSSWTQVNKYTYDDGQAEGCWYDSNGNFIGDGRTELLPEDDAATANWGSEWQMPSFDQIQELYNSSYTTTEWTQVNGVSGRRITSKSNGKSIFLPATGYRDEASLYGVGGYGYYWSRSLDASDSYYAYGLYFYSDYVNRSYYDRGYGRSVRPVRVDESVITR